jgi:hypothetical protein
LPIALRDVKNNSNPKIKPMTTEQLVTTLDRLTRFKETETKYLRVFKDIISSNLIEPKFKKAEMDRLDYEQLRDLAQYIINSSIETSIECDADYTINRRLLECENSLFNLDEQVQILLENEINYAPIIPLVEARRGGKLCFPPRKIILTEGITEEILLPEFAKFCGYDFEQNGVHIISAGGKNQVVKYFYRLYESLKIPIFVLFDNDAAQNSCEITPKLRPGDKIHLIENGEFEDLLPISLIKKTLNYSLKNFYKVEESDLVQGLPMVKILEEFFKRQGLNEFKKSDFAQLVKKNISSEADVSAEIRLIIEGIK